jgi:hypothetical protein
MTYCKEHKRSGFRTKTAAAKIVLKNFVRGSEKNVKVLQCQYTGEYHITSTNL